MKNRSFDARQSLSGGIPTQSERTRETQENIDPVLSSSNLKNDEKVLILLGILHGNNFWAKNEKNRC